VQDPASESDDAQLIAAVLAGDTERFSEIVNRYRASLLRVAQSRLGRRDWAEDAIQEAFLCAFRSLRTYDSHYSFRTWLWTILLNQCRRQYQKHARVPKIQCWSEQTADADACTAAEPLVVESGSAPPDAALLARERVELLENLLARIPPNQADALRLRFFGEMKFQEIADTMGCSLSSAKYRVKWGLTKMSELLGDRENCRRRSAPIVEATE
jgi:RNA polymerase sigma-70 factor (ECF subfamily)